MTAVHELMSGWTSGPLHADADGSIAFALGSATVAMRVLERSDGEATLLASWPIPNGLARETVAEMTDGVARQRSGLLRCAQREADVEISMTIYTDGLSRQAFANAAGEVARAHEALTTWARGLQSASVTATPAAAVASPEPVWMHTHVVPTSGSAAWSAPDPTQQPIANLAPGTQLQVTEQRGAWAYVVASNGWTGWVDGRVLVPRN